MDAALEFLPALEAPLDFIDQVETVITSLAESDSAQVSYSDEGYLWRFRYGTVEVLVQLTGTTEADVFTVWSCVLVLPVKDELGLHRRLLHLNWTTTMEARFALLGNEVVVAAARTVADLSAGEISRTITLVASLADLFDEELQQAFPPE